VSPHEYQLRPADVLRVRNSALLVWVGPAMEPWLAQLVSQQPAHKNLAPLPADAPHMDDGTHGPEHDVQRDPHIWLNPLALREKANAVAVHLMGLFPEHTEEIHQRQVQFEKDMAVLDTELSARFSPVAARGFVVYHDGYQRLVQRYHLNQRAAVWHHESIAGGVRDRAKLLELLNGGGVRCLFYEPEHGADVINNWLGKAAQSVKMVELDPLGAAVNDYTDFLRGLSEKMVGCLQ
jgi:zinc transport system substrate-binding protein